MGNDQQQTTDETTSHEESTNSCPVHGHNGSNQTEEPTNEQPFEYENHVL